MPTKPFSPHRGGLVYPACASASSACRGGRLPCPTPDACRTVTEDRDEPSPFAHGLLVTLGIVGGCALIAIGGPALWHWIARGLA